jgi:hypothetical protein
MVLGAIDSVRVAAVCAAVGPQRLRELVLLLGGRVAQLAAAAALYPDAAEDFMAALHQSRGSAASLGLVALAEGLACVEARAKTSGDVAAAGRGLIALWEDVKEELLF